MQLCSSTYPKLPTGPEVGWGGEPELESDRGREDAGPSSAKATRHVPQIEGLDALEGVDLRATHVVLGFDHWVHANQADDLIRFLQRRDVGGVSVDVRLCADFRPAEWSELLEALNAHPSLQSLQLAVEGALSQDTREALARSPACLRLGGSRMWAMLFHPLLRSLERSGWAVGEAKRQLAVLRAFVKAGVPGAPHDPLPAHTASALLALCLHSKDRALLLALGTLLRGQPAWVSRLPDVSTCRMMRATQVPWAFACSLGTPAHVDDLRARLQASERSSLPVIDLSVSGPLGAGAWKQLVARLRVQVDNHRLREVVLRLESDDPIDIGELRPCAGRLPVLSLNMQSTNLGDEQLQAIARLVRLLRPKQLNLAVLDLSTVPTMLRHLDSPTTGSVSVEFLNVGWAQWRHNTVFSQSLLDLLSRFKGPGFVRFFATRPIHQFDLDRMDELVGSQPLLLGYEVVLDGAFPFDGQARPSDHGGAVDDVGPKHVHRKAGPLLAIRHEQGMQTFIKQQLMGAAVPDEVTGRILAQGFHETDRRAMASVSMRVRREGSAAALAWALLRQRIDGPALRRWLLGSSGTLDRDLVSAIRLRLRACPPAQAPASTAALSLLDKVVASF